LGTLFRVVEDIGGDEGVTKGSGVVACQRIPRGTIITRERPLLSIRGDEVGLKDVTDGAAWSAQQMATRYTKQFPRIKEKVEALDEDARSLYLALSDATTHSHAQRALLGRLQASGQVAKKWDQVFTLTSVPAPDLSDGLHHENGMKSFEGIWCSNAIPGARNEQAVYATICRFNHSCTPNAAYKWRDDEGNQVVLAARDIEEGEEICVSYFDGRFQAVDKRRERTLESWGFRCQCEACRLDGAEAEASTRRRGRLVELDQALNGISDLVAHGKLWHEMKELYVKEHLMPNVFVERTLTCDLLQAQAAFGGRELSKLCAEMYELQAVIEGSAHREALLYKTWSEKLPPPRMILQLVDEMSRA